MMNFVLIPIVEVVYKIVEVGFVEKFGKLAGVFVIVEVDPAVVVGI